MICRSVIAIGTLTLFLGGGTAAMAQKTEPHEYVVTSVPDPLPKPTHPGLRHARSADRLELGRKLFFDPMLSLDRTIACSNCHKPELAFADSVATSKGVGGKTTGFNAPSLVNRYLGESFMWDGRFATLEAQVTDPIDNEKEMALGVPAALKRLQNSKEYPALFAKAWPKRELDKSTLASSLAHFIRHLRRADSPVDRFRSGDANTLNNLEKRGLWLYESRGRCWQCHDNANFSNESFHNTGVSAQDGKPELGRFAHTKKDQDRGRFKTPTLRGLTLTAPYMHDGSMKTLKEVVEFYRDGGTKNSHLDARIRPIALDDKDVDALVAFLKALSR